MTHKQPVIRAEIAKLDGKKSHTVNPQVLRRKKSIGEAAGLVTFDVPLI